SAVYEAMLPRQPLRFVLADDPGAGKTIMAGLFIRELMLRGDLERCLIICPGSLVEQWQTELSEKFGLRFDILTNALVESTATGSFYGKAQKRAEPKDVSDIMRRMVKEDLITFDGSRLFPERRAETVKYKLSPAEKALYDKVTDYVRNQMGRADKLQGKKKGM